MSDPGHAAVPPRRIGDEERERVAGLLSDHVAAGRLTQDEFSERLGHALAARTTTDLGRAVGDLPVIFSSAERGAVDVSDRSSRTVGVPGVSSRWVVGGLIASGGISYAAVVAGRWVGSWGLLLISFALVMLAAVVGIVSGFRAGKATD